MKWVSLGPVAAVVAFGVSLGACGSGDAEVGELSTSQFASKANQACARVTTQVDGALKNVNAGVPTGTASAQAIARVASLDRELIRRIDDLAAPEAEQDEIDRLLDHWRDRARLEDEISKTVTAGSNATTLDGFNSQLEQVDDTANTIARELGLDKCERGGT